MQVIPTWFVLHQNAIMLLTQAVLATVITGLLLSRRQKSPATWLLTGVYGALTGFLWSYLMVASAYLITWLILVGVCIVLLGVTLIQFAYHFPHPSPAQGSERRVILGLSLLALAIQIGLGVKKLDFYRKDARCAKGFEMKVKILYISALTNEYY